jgi:hypothetical protein
MREPDSESCNASDACGNVVWYVDSGQDQPAEGRQGRRGGGLWCMQDAAIVRLVDRQVHDKGERDWNTLRLLPCLSLP